MKEIKEPPREEKITKMLKNNEVTGEIAIIAEMLKYVQVQQKI